ncbi:TonB-dependent receptor [Pseudoduganella sp. SL102]|uniref:TonB-dependent receptor family protein n=1 Tax=Pseudoduganella sp. SL102 TaxID=2995154 RepID=UPI00248AF129|nr:TonB-dependent receptor [Pseudoduganella sp. SL102]WBS03609.1 TonB-dependent receptor [Pseudoduganella sp. SL102]
MKQNKKNERYPRKKRNPAIVGLGTALCLASGAAAAQQAVNAAGAAEVLVGATVIVNGQALRDSDKARARLDQIAGTASVVKQADVERGRSANAEDVLAYQPGVFAAATSGNGANKISIRGSGLNAFYQGYSLGIKYLYDGLPITGPGGTQEDLLTLNGLDYTEVLNGANAFSYAALSLGGAINFVTHTGRSAPGTSVSAEAGSHGYRKFGLGTGGVSADNKTDYYLAYFYNERDGFQRDTPNSGNEYVLNLGHEFSNRVETRLTVRHRNEELRNGSTITLAQLEADPRQNNSTTSARKKTGTTLITSKTTFTLDARSKLELGLAYNDYPLDNGWRYSTTPQDWRSTDGSVSLRYLRTGDTLFGKRSDTTVAFSDTRLLHGDVKAYDQDLATAVRTTERQYTVYTGSRDTVLSLANELQLSDELALSTGLSLIEVDRDAHIDRTTLTTTESFPRAVRYNEHAVAPRVGLRYQATPDLAVFGNVSRSIDPPVTWQMGSTGVPYIRPLKPQKATTAEIGLRAGGDSHEGTLSLYRSWISGELLSTVVRQASQGVDALIANANAGKTIHQGIEAALTSRLWKSAEGSRLSYRQAYTFSDFHYRDDPRYGGNELPSLPRHVYQGELLFQRAGGFYAGLNTRALSGYYVDYANSLKAPSAVIWAAKFGYEDPAKKWKAYLDFRNLGDKHYASAANTVDNARGRDSANFYPGDGFSVYSGVVFRF